VIRVVLVILLLVCLIIFVNYYRKSSVVKKRKIIRVTLFVVLIIVMAGFVIAGRLNWLAAVGGTLLPLLPKMASWLFRNASSVMMLINKFKQNKEGMSSGKMHGQQSSVETLYLIMTLDHDTGDMNGKVIRGEFKGKLLSDLKPAEIRKMLNECEDRETESLLMAYLDRYHRRQQPNENSDDEKSNKPDFMSVHEAREILGLEENAKKTDIINAHRKLIQKLHPDRGGSEYLAMKINRAKDVLLSTL